MQRISENSVAVFEMANTSIVKRLLYTFIPGNVGVIDPSLPPVHVYSIPRIRL